MILEIIDNLIEEVKLGLPTREAARSYVAKERTKRAYSTFKNADIGTKAKIYKTGATTAVKKNAGSIASMVGTTAMGLPGIDLPDAHKVYKEIKTDPSRLKNPSYLGGVAARLSPGNGAFTAAKSLTHDAIIHGTKQMGIDQRRQK